jgi:nucleotide-binding universal stress UspA family protein
VILSVIRDGRDLVMINAEGGRRSWFGSTVTHLLRKCPCPVWVLRPEPLERYGRILAAVDCDPAEDGRFELKRRILEIGTSLARLQGAELHVATAWSVLGEASIRARVGASGSQIELVREAARKEHEERLEELPTSSGARRAPSCPGSSGRSTRTWW